TKDVVQLIQSEDFFRQLIMDGRTDRVTFVGTHADDVNHDEACQQYNLDPEAPVADILDARKQNLREVIDRTLSELSEGLADRAGEERSKAHALAARLSQYKLFSVSARDALAFVMKGRTKPRLDTLQQTELPVLRQYLDDLAGSYGVEHHAQLVKQQLRG